MTTGTSSTKSQQFEVDQRGYQSCYKLLSVLTLFLILYLQLQIWDTAGQERFRTITQSYYRSADAIVLVYDIGAATSFRNLPEWLSEVERYAGNNVTRILIGNFSHVVK